mgnify:CR=1 FL=1
MMCAEREMYIWWILTACVTQPGAGHGPGGGSQASSSDPNALTDNDSGRCPDGASCNPTLVVNFPFATASDTSSSSEAHIDRWACAPDIDESGPELWYVIEVGEPGVLSASIDDVRGDGVDADVHLLSSPDPQDCVARGNAAVARVVQPGTWYVVIDTWAYDGETFPGPFELTIDLIPTRSGPCAIDPVDVRMYWPECAPDIACIEGTHTDGSDAIFLATPCVGPVVKEAHLVTTEDDYRGRWPGSFTHGIAAHYAASEAAGGYKMDRTEPWAPDGEGGPVFGQGATGLVVPALDEAWYVNMYWRDRPPKGTRLIVMNPFDGRAVVASGGYETGPGSNASIGGAAEEIHHALGTQHRDLLVMGFAADQSLPLGPLECR